jgi:hypothetical protein
MRKRVQIALAVLIVVLAGVSAWLGLREREPVYQGRSLSNWLEGYTPSPGVFALGGRTVQVIGSGGGPLGNHFDSTKVDAAVRQIGTNAHPTLCRMLRAKDSALRLKLLGFAQKHTLTAIRMKPTPDGTLKIRGVHGVIEANPTLSETLNFRAVAGFRALGSDASNAVPELIEMYKHSPGSGPWGPGAALAAIGPAAGEAIPSLVLNVGNTNAGAREIAIRALSEIHSQSQLVVPALIAALRDPDGSVRGTAACSLKAFGAEAKAAVPALLELLKDKDEYARGIAAEALGQIDPEAAAKAGVKPR